MFRHLRFQLLPLLLVLLAACSQPVVPAKQSELLQSQAVIAALHDQTDNRVFDQLAYPGSYFADDFVVPAGEAWVIDEVGIVNPAQFHTGSTQSVAFFASDPGTTAVPGALVARSTFQAAEVVARDGLQVVALAEPVALEAGTYWVGFEAYGVYLRTAAIGKVAVVGSEGAFSPLTYLEPYDLAFALFGTTADLATPTFDGLLAAFDAFVTEGGLVGSGPNERSGSKRLHALRNMLSDAGALYPQGLLEEACAQLSEAGAHVHGDGALLRSHFATGASAAELSALIVELSEVVCE